MAISALPFLLNLLHTTFQVLCRIMSMAFALCNLYSFGCSVSLVMLVIFVCVVSWVLICTKLYVLFEGEIYENRLLDALVSVFLLFCFSHAQFLANDFSFKERPSHLIIDARYT